MKNVLLINGHQRYEGFAEGKLNRTLTETANDFLISKGYDVKITIVDSGYDIAEEHGKYPWADVVIVQTPVYWMSVPYLFKKYIDEVFTSAVGKVLPHLNGKLQAISIRVPTPNVSLVDAVYTLSKEASVEEINNAFIEASNGKLKGILAVSELPLVSIDYNGSPSSATVDLPLTMSKGNQVKIVAWYDNESGYSNRMVDLALYVNKKN